MTVFIQPATGGGSVTVNPTPAGGDVTITPMPGAGGVTVSPAPTGGTIEVIPVEGIPGQGVAAGGTTGQVLAKQSNADYDTYWMNAGSAAVWGAITGTLSAQTDLQTALDGKQAAGSYANATHTHVIADVTGLQTELDGKQAVGSYQPLATVLTNTTASFTTAQETKLSGIATGATANALDADLRDRATHTGAQAISTVTGLQTALDGKQPLATVLTNTTAAFTTAQETKLAGVETGATANTGTVTSVGGTGTVSGLTLSGSVTSSGNLTLGGTLTLTSGNVTTALGFTPYNDTNPANYINVGQARLAISAAGSLSYNSTTGVISFTDAVSSVAGKTGAITLDKSDVGLNNVENKSSATIRGEITSSNVTTALGFTPYNATNPNGYTTNTGTVTSVSGTGTVSGLTLSGSVTGSGNLTLGGTLSLTKANVTTALGYTPADLAGDTFTGPVAFTGNIGNSPTAIKGVWVGKSSGEDGQIQINGSFGQIDWADQTEDYDIRLMRFGNDELLLMGGHIRAETSLRAPIFYDADNTNFYIDPAGTSYVTNTRHVRGGHLIFERSEGAGIGGMGWHTNDFFYVAGHPSYGPGAGNNVRVYGFGSSLRLGTASQGDVLTIFNGFTTATGSLRTPIYYDSNDTNYYIDPNSNSRLRNLNLGGGGGFDATIHITGAQGGNGRLTQMSPDGASQAALNIMASRNSSNSDQWWSWGVQTDNTWKIQTGVGFGGNGITIDDSGNLTASGNITAYSDSRLKEGIKPITDAISKVQQLNGVTYTRNDLANKERRYGGLLAQDVQKVLPEAVFETDGKLGVDYSATLGLCVEAIKQIASQLETLKTKG